MCIWVLDNTIENTQVFCQATSVAHSDYCDVAMKLRTVSLYWVQKLEMYVFLSSFLIIYVIWSFPKIGVPPNHPFIMRFYYKPSIFGMALETSIFTPLLRLCQIRCGMTWWLLCGIPALGDIPGAAGRHLGILLRYWNWPFIVDDVDLATKDGGFL